MLPVQQIHLAAPCVVSLQADSSTKGRDHAEEGRMGFSCHSAAADKRINGFFAKTASDPERLKTFKMHLVNQICEAGGGPCKYTGKDMKTAHVGMGVSGADFNALVEDLVGALDKFKVGKTEKDQLLAALGPMKGDIVEKP